MLGPLQSAAQQEAHFYAKRAGMGLAASAFLIVGIGFLTAAGWMALTLVTTPLYAALILGGAFSGVGLILLARSQMIRRKQLLLREARRSFPATTSAGLLASLAVAFSQGFSAGSGSAKRTNS